MTLKKEICKKCYEKYVEGLPKGERWNEFAEVWFTGPCKHVWCPPVFHKKIGENITRKLVKSLNDNETEYLNWAYGPKPWIENDSLEQHISKFFRLDRYQHIEDDPPFWCPYKKDHKTE